MINNVKFNLATGGNTYNVVPLVTIVSNSGIIANHFSTQPINVDLSFSYDTTSYVASLSYDPLL